MPRRVALGIAVAVVCVATVALRSRPRDDAPTTETAPPRAHETIIGHPYRMLERSLTTSMGYNRSLQVFRIENRDTFPWTDCLFSLNSHGIASGFTREVEAINPGLTEAAFLQSSEFLDDAGKKFDPALNDVATLDLYCETRYGRLYYGGKFEPATLRTH